MRKKQLITGITGQDGYYLTKFLLDKDYEIYGILRRNSQKSYGNLQHLTKQQFNKLHLYYQDITDYMQIQNIIKSIQPNELYHLAQQSYVGLSFKNPKYTYETNIDGTLNIQNQVKDFSPDTKVYFAQTSEMFGKVQEIPQKETTPFYPMSPYGTSKVQGFWTMVNYRESYDLFMSNGILFNHESIPSYMPIMIRNPSNNWIDILQIEELFPSNDKHKYSGILKKYKNYEIWDGNKFVKILNGTVYQDKNKKTKIIQTRGGFIDATLDHIIFDNKNFEHKIQDIKIGDMLYKTEIPIIDSSQNDIDLNLAKFIGFVVGDGNITADSSIRISGTNIDILYEVTNNICKNYKCERYIYNSGKGGFSKFKEDRSNYHDVYAMNIKMNSNLVKWIKENIYNRNHYKKVPIFILNGSYNTKKAFLDGYYLADGLKKSKQKGEYKAYTSNSIVLITGLNFLIKNTTKQDIRCTIEFKNNKKYYHIGLRTANKKNNKGNHLMKELYEVVKINDGKSSDNWYYDIQTESQTFAVGPALYKVHNSPIRGLEFVTRKITNTLQKIKYGKQDVLQLGNIYSKRDWGYAGDYVKAMWMILQHDKPDNFVIQTNKVHSVKEFVEIAQDYFGFSLIWKNTGIDEIGIDMNTNKTIVSINKEYYRPNDVTYLQGDYSKQKQTLGWKPKTQFTELVHRMCEYDDQLVRGENNVES